VSGIEDAVAAAVADAGVPHGAPVLVAISGGPDSTALLRALAALREGLSLTITACIVDHGIRSSREVKADISFARALCAALSIPLHVARVPRGELQRLARESGRSLEETAREARYRLLREAARGARAHRIALGHTEDDVVETLLMRVLQGSGVDGLRGIPFRRGPFFRPLLHCTRLQVIGYLASLSQDWREDLTNRDTAMLRNRVRHLLIPLLEESFPGHREGLLTMRRRLMPVSELVRSQAAVLPWRRSGSGFAMPRGSFFTTPAAVRACSLMHLYDSFRDTEAPRRLPWRFLAPSLRDDPGRNGLLLLGYGAALQMGPEIVSWGPRIASKGKKGYFIEAYEAGNTAIRGAGVSLRLTRSRGKACAERGVLSLLADKAHEPFVLRSRRKGDEILLEGGATSLKELFAGWKIPGRDRERIPVLADRKGVLAVLGGALGYSNRARAGAVGGDLEIADRIEVRILKAQGRGT
jgi:tRNA(Ile)-lysidine synthase